MSRRLLKALSESAFTFGDRQQYVVASHGIKPVSKTKETTC